MIRKAKEKKKKKSEGITGQDPVVYDVCVVGGGSGGIGAALTAARKGAKVVLIEALDKLGGTGTNALVSNWAAGPGNPLALEAYEDLSRTKAVGIARSYDKTNGLPKRWLIDPQSNYVESLQSNVACPGNIRIVPFEPRELADWLKEKLDETSNCTLLFNTRLIEADANDNRVTGVTAQSNDGTSYKIQAGTFIDSTGGVELCRKLNIPCALGESDAPFNYEDLPQPPIQPPLNLELNSISLCYRVSQIPDHDIPMVPVDDWSKNAQLFQVPGGDFIINPLLMLPGVTLINEGYEKTFEMAEERVEQHWSYMRTQYSDFFKGYKFLYHGTLLGIRESYRVIGEYMLTKDDVLSGLKIGPGTIAAADHPIDLHLATTLDYPEGFQDEEEVDYPYGIPFECLIPQGWKNLLAACRGASFSHEAASSCRLSRTMISLGMAAGTAAVLAMSHDIDVRDVNLSDLINELRGPFIH